MSSSPPPDKLERQKALLAKLEGRLFRASQLAPATSASPPRSSAELIPGLERVSVGSGELSRLRLAVELTGAPTVQGVYFPCRTHVSMYSGESLAMLAQDEEFRELPLETICFLDCETTGLAGGTGTVSFLVGLGFFENEQFVVEQYFMEDYDEEGPMVEALCERMRQFEAIVSYNGKSYDVPLLRTRFIFHRRPSLWEKPHLDLLHCARRFWRGRLPDCSLHSIERSVLGLRRISDVDGYLIPQIYFDYVRGKRREQMIPVFDHHAQDIVSLAALAARLSRMIEQPLDGELHTAEDQMRLAGFFVHCGRNDRAVACLETALLRLHDPLAIHLVSMRLARLYKKAGRWTEAAEIWQAQVESGPSGRIEPYVELAKYFEHQLRDVSRAHAVVERAIRLSGSQNEMRHYLKVDGAGESTADDLNHRLERLQGRLQKQADKDRAE